MAPVPDMPCAVCGKLLYRTRSSLPEGQATCRPCRAELRTIQRTKTCQGCGQVFQAESSKARYCTAACSYQARQSRVLACTVCGTQFVNKGGTGSTAQKTCSRACGLLAKRLLGEVAWPSSALTWKSCRVCSESYTQQGGRLCGCDTRYYVLRTGTTRQATCRYCSVSFPYVVKGMGGKALVCEACKLVHLQAARRAGRHVRRARLRGAYVETVNVVQVYERDRWRCQLCGKPVQKRKQAPHPLSPSLDHIIPLSKGGTHEPANCQLAHFICNSRKGNRGGGEQLLLIG